MKLGGNNIVPSIETERLILREYRREDFDAFAEHLSDPVSAAHLALADRPTAWRIFSSHAGLWLVDGTGWWSIVMRETNELVGNVGAFYREEKKNAEIGWNTYRSHWGKGIAGEAAAAVLRFTFEQRNEEEIQALIAPDNYSSISVATHLGMTCKQDTEIHGKTVGIYSKRRDGKV